MPDFRTVLNTPVAPYRMAISERIFTIGSCFSDAIGERLSNYKIPTHRNPAGILYSPHAIHRILQTAIRGSAPAETNFIAGEPAFHYDFHSSISAMSTPSLRHKLVQVLNDCHTHLRETSWLIVTYGTAWVYRRKDNGDMVANCHKQPSSGFEKTLLNTAEIEASFRQLVTDMHAYNPALKIILTVSPVRHLKDTLEGNAVSKSVLRVACNNMVSEHANVFYFPAFELMIDDLRDYRFYKSDMIHPNEVGEEYIWDQFARTWFNDALLTFIESWKGIRQALHHRPFHPDTQAHQRFLRATLERVNAWSSFVNVEEERQHLLNQLIAT